MQDLAKIVYTDPKYSGIVVIPKELYPDYEFVRASWGDSAAKDWLEAVTCSN